MTGGTRNDLPPPPAAVPRSGGGATPSPDGQVVRGRAARTAWARRLRSARDAAARFPVTFAVVVTPPLVGAVTGSLVAGPAATVRTVVGASVAAAREDRWWTALTSVPWCAQWLGCVATSAATAVLLPVAERRLGALRTVIALIVLQVVGVGIGIAAVAGLRGSGRWAAQLDETVMLGPSAAVVGVVLLASAALGPLWRRRLRLLLVSGLAVMALYSGMLGDLLRLFTGLVGLAAGPLVLPRTREAPPRPSSRSETRVLVTLLVALSALGPLVAALAQTRIGPLAVLRYVFTSPVPDPAVVNQVCADPLAAEECAALQARAQLRGLGSALMSVMPVVLLLVTAAGLWRGRRAAWLAALILNLVLGVLGLALAWHTASRAVDQLVLLGSGLHVHAWLVLGLPALQPLVVAAVLVVTRRRFREPAPPGALKVSGRVVGTAALATVGVFVGGCLLLRRGFTPPPDLAAVLADLPARLLPPVYLGELEPAFLPVTAPARWLFEGVGPVFWGVVCAAALRTFLGDRYGASDDDRRRLTALAQRGGSTVSWMATWPGNAAWFTPDGRGGFAYRVIGGVALTVGGPIGDADVRGQAVDGFLAHCRERGWTPALYSVDGAIVDVVRERGWAAVQVAEDTLLPLGELAFTGKRWQDVRTALNRARRDGITAEATTYARAPWRMREQIRAISEEWSAEKGLPEMGFTLGGLTELDDPRVRLLPAVDAAGTVLAVTSWLPVHEDGVQIGWTLDFMRRRPSAPGGIMEFLIATAALDAQADGLTLLSLSGAPLARAHADEPARGVPRLLDLLALRLEPLYGFRSLSAFKAKFQPTYRPLYLAYPDPVVLPAVAAALARAYLPDHSPRQMSRLLKAVLS